MCSCFCLTSQFLQVLARIEFHIWHTYCTNKTIQVWESVTLNFPNQKVPCKVPAKANPPDMQTDRQSDPKPHFVWLVPHKAICYEMDLHILSISAMQHNNHLISAPVTEILTLAQYCVDILSVMYDTRLHRSEWRGKQTPSMTSYLDKKPWANSMGQSELFFTTPCNRVRQAMIFTR